MMPSKELKNAFLGRKRKEGGRRKKEEERGYSSKDFLPTANNYDTHCIILINEIP